MTEIELLAPAGSPEALVAAVENGADAVYLGAGAFNARRGAENFDSQALRRAVEYCHVRDVRVHVTVNTLVRQDELFSLCELAREIAASGADAAIVQDLGVAEVFRRVAPWMELHASTQLAVHNLTGVEYLKRQGFARAVLAREMSLEEISACRKAGLPLEAFCHGALCVSCSGQCLFSSLVGGRSGNRGMCAQPCRLPYSLDGKKGYLLSTRDLVLVDWLDALKNAGVTSLKIEGRMRRPEYVAVVTGVYRRALDGHPVTARDREALLQMFNRGGGTSGYLNGVRDAGLIFPDRPNHLGLPVGTCRKNGQIHVTRDLDANDVLVLRRPGREDTPVRLSGMANDTLSLRGARPGDTLVRLVSQRQTANARASYQMPSRLVPASAELVLRIGDPARLSLSDGKNRVEAEGPTVECATNRPADARELELRVKKSGGTAFSVNSVEVEADEMAYLPVSAINGLRREALDALQRARLDAFGPHIAQNPPKIPDPQPIFGGAALVAQSGDCDVLLRARKAGADSIAFSPTDVRPAALEHALEALAGQKFALVIPQVLSQQPLEALHAWANAHADRIVRVYLSNAAHLALPWRMETFGDYPLNVCNTLTVQTLLDDGLAGFTPSVELTGAQISALGGPNELIVYGRIPLMQLRHCPLRRARGENGPHAGCRDCDARDEVLDQKALVDRKGVRFPLRRIATQAGCVIQVLNSVPMMLLNHISRLPTACGWRMLLDCEDDVGTVVSLYDAARRGKDARCLPAYSGISSLPATTGHYFRGVE